MAVVFVAKENTEFIALLRLHLESYGHDVRTAYSVHEVRQRLPTSGADVVLLGLVLRNEHAARYVTADVSLVTSCVSSGRQRLGPREGQGIARQPARRGVTPRRLR